METSNLYAYSSSLSAIVMYVCNINYDWGNEDTVCVYFTAGSLTVGAPYIIGGVSTGNGYMAFSAEL